MLVTAEDKFVVCSVSESEFSEYLNFRLFKNKNITLGNLILQELILRTKLVFYIKYIGKGWVWGRGGWRGVLINSG